MSNSPNGEIIARPAVIRRDLDGPVLDDLAKATTPAIAALDARWTAAVLAGGAHDTSELEDWLQMLGLLPAPVFWMGGDRS